MHHLAISALLLETASAPVLSVSTASLYRQHFEIPSTLNCLCFKSHIWKPCNWGIVLQFVVIKMLTWISLPPASRYSCTVTSSLTWGGSRWHCFLSKYVYTRDDIQRGIAPSPCFLPTAIRCSALRYYHKRLLLDSFRPFKKRFENKLPIKYLNSIYLSICDNFCLFPACTSASSSSSWIAHDPVPRVLSAILCTHVKWY